MCEPGMVLANTKPSVALFGGPRQAAGFNILQAYSLHGELQVFGDT